MFLHRQMLQLRRDDGTCFTLLRKRPTTSRSADAFVKPNLSLGSADSVAFLQTVEGRVQCLRCHIYLMISMFNFFRSGRNAVCPRRNVFGRDGLRTVQVPGRNCSGPRHDRQSCEWGICILCRASIKR
jgi:hypothetical protein